MELIKDELSVLKQDSTEQVAPQKMEYKKIGSMILKTGMKLWAYNPSAGTVEEVHIDRKSAACDFNGNAIKNGKVLYDPMCIYIQALNRKNAERKARKMLEKIFSKNSPN
jgi:hypothetical protein